MLPITRGLYTVAYVTVSYILGYCILHPTPVIFSFQELFRPEHTGVTTSRLIKDFTNNVGIHVLWDPNPLVVVQHSIVNRAFREHCASKFLITIVFCLTYFGAEAISSIRLTDLIKDRIIYSRHVYAVKFQSCRGKNNLIHLLNTIILGSCRLRISYSNKSISLNILGFRSVLDFNIKLREDI